MQWSGTSPKAEAQGTKTPDLLARWVGLHQQLEIRNSFFISHAWFLIYKKIFLGFVRSSKKNDVLLRLESTGGFLKWEFLISNSWSLYIRYKCFAILYTIYICIYIHIYGRISDSLYHGNACVQKTFISGWTASFILQILPIPTQRLRPCPKPRIKTDIHGNTRALQPDLWPRPQCQRWAI